MNAAKRPAPDPIPERPTNGTRVQPDTATKRNVGFMYAAAMALMGFLALQVWTMNGRMAAIEANDRAQEKTGDRQEKALERLETAINAMRTEFRNQIEGLRSELRKGG